MGEESKWAANVSEKHQPAHERVRESRGGGGGARGQVKRHITFPTSA